MSLILFVGTLIGIPFLHQYLRTKKQKKNEQLLRENIEIQRIEMERERMEMERERIAREPIPIYDIEENDDDGVY